MGGGNMEYMREGGKPDFLDLDKDGNKTESMKSAAASAKEMSKGGRMYRMGGMNEMGHGGVHKYPHGGVHDPVPPGSVQGNQKFRVIPEKSTTGQTELAYYIDGRPVESQVFQQQFYDAGNKPQDLNQLIENSMIAATQGIGAESGISGGSPLEGLLKSYRDALKERDVYKEKGAAGIDSLYQARKDNYDRMIRQMGG